jgi:hypothetical protein
VALVLTVQAVETPGRWRWLLTGDEVRRDARVALDPQSAEFRALQDLPKHDVDLGTFAAWIGREIFGGFADLLEDTTVVVQVGGEAAFLPAYPLELAVIDGRSLAERGVTLIYELASAAPERRKQPIGDRLRVLALYSLPSGWLPLALRQERYAFARNLRQIASSSGRAIELRILQYGVTRHRLSDACEEGAGWDVLHVSGHGVRGTLVLEHDDGSPDEVPTGELVELLRPARPRLKLVTMSVCHSGADGAATILRAAQLPEAAAKVQAVAEAERSTPDAGLAYGLVERLGTVVLAMRYAVGDRFATQLTGEFYRLLIAQGQTVARALALALPRASGKPLSAASPMLFGAAAETLMLTSPRGSELLDPYAERMAGFPAEAVTFVGRAAAMSQATAVLAPDSPHFGVLFRGPRGIGTTACALELAHQHRQRFGRLAWWHPPGGNDLRATLLSLSAAWSGQVGLSLRDGLRSLADLHAFLPRLRAQLRESSVLLAIDDVSALLSPAGTWRDPWWEPLFATLTGHGGFTRLVLTGDIEPPGLDGMPVLVQPLGPLSPLEQLQALETMPHLGALLPHGLDVPRGADPVPESQTLRRLLVLVGGHPGLLAMAESVAARVPVLAGPPRPADAGIHERLAARYARGDDPAAIEADLLAALTGSAPREVSAP